MIMHAERYSGICPTEITAASVKGRHYICVPSYLLLVQLNTANLYVASRNVEKNIIPFYNAIGGDEVKVSIQENPDIRETEVVIHCNKADELVEKIISAVETANGRLIGSMDGVIYQIDLSEILYIEIVVSRQYASIIKNVLEA